MNPFIAAAAQLLGRFLMSAIFIQGGLGKLASPGATMDYIASAGLPNPQIALYASIAVELGRGILILLGVLTRPVAFIMAGFCLVTGALFHYHPDDVNQMTNLMKNICMAGGFLQLFAVGAGALSVDALMFRRR